MRSELEPDIDIAVEFYPKVEDLLDKYLEHYSKNKGNKTFEHDELKNKLKEITGKDYTQNNFDRFDYYFERGFINDVEYWILSIPEPNIVNNITRKEVVEILRRLKNPLSPFRVLQFLNIKVTDIFCPKKILRKWRLYSNNRITYRVVYYYYYTKLLMVNFKKCKLEYLKKSEKDYKTFQFSIDEIVEKIWDK